MKKIVYDFGANNGDDIDYYLVKADKVVAIEANPKLAKLIERRFASEIRHNRLVVENCVVKSKGDDGEVDFYIHKSNHVLSQFPRPQDDIISEFAQTTLPSRNLKSILGQHGPAYYIKIDIEHYDAEILKSLFGMKIFPWYLSAEAHSPEIFDLLKNAGYKKFKLVDGPSVSEEYTNVTINGLRGKVDYSFPHHSAGPFGEDIKGFWMSAFFFKQYMKRQGFGWKDIHVKRSVSFRERLTQMFTS